MCGDVLDNVFGIDGGSKGPGPVAAKAASTKLLGGDSHAEVRTDNGVSDIIGNPYGAVVSDKKKKRAAVPGLSL